MRAHRVNVLKVLSLLAYMLKNSNPDGLKIVFTQSSTKINSKKSSRLLTSVHQVDFQGVSDMRARLSHILQEYKSDFGITVAPPESRYQKTNCLATRWPLSFYVLTDGKWQPNEVGPIIKALVESMQVNRLPKEHVGIQFISFGNDPCGIERLDHLDQGLSLKSIDM